MLSLIPMTFVFFNTEKCHHVFNFLIYFRNSQRLSLLIFFHKLSYFIPNGGIIRIIIILQNSLSSVVFLLLLLCFCFLVFCFVYNLIFLKEQLIFNVSKSCFCINSPPTIIKLVFPYFIESVLIQFPNDLLHMKPNGLYSVLSSSYFLFYNLKLYLFFF